MISKLRHFAPQGLVRAFDATTEVGQRFFDRMACEDSVTPKVMGVGFEALTLTTTDGLDLAAWYVPGDPAGALGLRLGVVLHHYYGGQKSKLLPWLQLFQRVGVDALAFDARGHGGSPADASGSDCFVERAADVHAACDELRRRGCSRLVGFGQSQGCAAVAIAAAQRDDMAGVIFDSGPAPAMEIAGWGLSGVMLQQARLEGRWGLRALVAARMLARTHPLRYGRALWTSLAALRNRRLLWVHGDSDVVIRRQWSHVWFRALAPRLGNAWQSHTVVGGQHVRSIMQGGPELASRIEQFLSDC